MSEGMFIACIIGATIVILTVFYAVILFIACIIDQHKREHERSCDDDTDSDGNSWIYGKAEIHDNARVYDASDVYGNTSVCGKSRICGDTVIYDNALAGGQSD